MSHFNCIRELKLLCHPPFPQVCQTDRPPAAEKQLCRHIKVMSVVFVDDFFPLLICMPWFNSKVTCCVIMVSVFPPISVGTNQNFQENHSFSFSSHYTHGVTSAIYHPGHRQVGYFILPPNSCRTEEEITRVGKKARLLSNVRRRNVKKGFFQQLAQQPITERQSCWNQSAAFGILVNRKTLNLPQVEGPGISILL